MSASIPELNQRQRHEARGWLSDANNHHVLERSAVLGVDDVRAFVEELYRLGAVRVEVDGVWENPYYGRFHDPYADEFIVTLPEEHRSAMAVLLRIAKEHPDTIDQYGDVVEIWWD